VAPPGLFEVLVDGEPAAPRCPLEEEYGAALLPTPGRVAVNFISTIDGVVSYGLGSGDSRAVGGGIPADRLLMAMLRAVAGVIVVGAGTLRVALDHQWTPAALAPERVDDLAALRAAAGRPAAPAPLLVVSTEADLPSGVAAVARPDTPLHVITPSQGADRVDGGSIVATATRLGGGGPILCEGGPQLFGSLLEDGVSVDLFLTVAPQLAGRAPGDGRRSLVEGVALPPFARAGRLLSARRAGEHLLLRFLVGESAA
jgi:riboflavin biosynthesis pyrimidine reductase